jgi:hypothetical protein
VASATASGTASGTAAGTAGGTATTWGDLARPALRRGVHVVRRDDRHLQLGLDPPDRLVLADQPGLRDTLLRLDRRPSDELLPLVDQLVRDGWVVDAASGGPDDGLSCPRPVTLAVDPALEAATLQACAAARLVPQQPRQPASLQLVATVGEPRRAASDALMRDDTPHLWLAVWPDAVRIGPYVEPGRTACLRCVDAHLGDLDPRRSTVLHQLEELPASDATADACLVQLGLAWAARDIARRLEGHDSSLRSATVTVTGDLEVTRRDWLRHPHCGCAWG